MTDLYVRSYNPIWNFRSLTGLSLDDNSYAYFLSNEIPYVPQAVYHTATGTAWNNPVQLSAAGTLENIFMDPDLVYRIEIRTNNGVDPVSQSDALVWLIENYVPNGSGSNPPITSGNLASDNQITNPQFSIVNFSVDNGYSISGSTDPAAISIAPGWDLVLSGTGDATITREDLTSTNANQSNAPYGLRVNLSSWTTAYLRQRFNQSGNLWASSPTLNKYVTGSITASISASPQILTITLHDNNTQLVQVLSEQLSSQLEQYSNVSPALPEPSNSTIPETAYVECRINLPGSSNILLSSVQLVSIDQQFTLGYEQQTIERQVDQTFHNYRDILLFQPHQDLLTGWDFPLNPWQFTTTTVTNLASTGGYTADQTIVITEEADSVQVGRSANPLGYFNVRSRIGQTQGRIALVQYIDAATIRSTWNNTVSSLVKLYFTTTDNTVLKFKMQLIWRDTAVAITDPISSWGATDPVYTAGWTAVNPVNSSEYTATSSLASYEFNGFSLPENTNEAAVLGIVLYTTTDTSSAAADNILIKSISLVRNEIATESMPLTFDETLRRCEYYYEKSYTKGVLPGAVTDVGVRTYRGSYDISSADAFSSQFTLKYNTVKRSDPTVTFYTPLASTADRFLVQVNRANTQPGVSSGSNPFTATTSTQLVEHAISPESVTYYSKSASAVMRIAAAAGGEEALQIFHYTLDSRMQTP